MVDPFSALAVATAAVQFVDFSYKCMSGIIGICQSIISEEGSSDALLQLKGSAERLQSSNLRLKSSLDQGRLGRRPTESEAEVIAVATECADVAAALLKTIRDFEPRDINRQESGDLQLLGLHKVQASIKIVWNKEKLVSLQQKLKDLRDQLTFVILLDLREDIKQFAGHLALNQNQSQSIWGNSQSVYDEILEQVKSMEQWQANLDVALRDVLESPAAMAPVIEGKGEVKIPPWHDTPVAKSLLSRLLHRLKFSQISIREERVAEAHQKTFEWVFLEPKQRIMNWHSFTNWLESDGNLYWITGKAGSGKSTLMKFILQDDRTKKHLKVWAEQTPLVAASYYFWLAGREKLQHTQEGLVRTLLYQALSCFEGIAPGAALTRWNSFALSKELSPPLSWADLEQAFRFLLDDRDFAVKYCFFVDGLDELKGDMSSLISLIHKISKHPNVKVCVSSRPWVVFEDAFRSKPHLTLQDLTYPDIKLYVETNLGASVAFQELRVMDEEIAKALIRNIANRSSGVFLWVVLVVRSLQEGLRDGDRLADLQRKLDSLPPELDDLFRNMMHNFDPRYIREASALFQFVKGSPCPLSLLCLSIADEEDISLEMIRSPNHVFYRALNMRRRLNSRCKGLLEVAPIRVKDNIFSNEITISPPENPTLKQGISNSGIQMNFAPGNTPVESTVILRDFSELPPEQGDLLANAEVDYLHRTVKDFLDQKDIWEQITAAIDSGFNPHVALARAYLLQLECLRDTLSSIPGAVWNGMFSVLEYLALEEASGVVQVPLLEKLEEVTFWLYHGLDWPIQPPSPPLDFLHLVVRCGLQLYLDRRLTSAQHSDKYIRSLLETAVSEYKIRYPRPKGTDFVRDEPSLAIVRVLLDHSNLPRKEKHLWLQKAQAALDKKTASSSVPNRQLSGIVLHGKAPDPTPPSPGLRDSTRYSNGRADNEISHSSKKRNISSRILSRISLKYREKLP